MGAPSGVPFFIPMKKDEDIYTLEFSIDGIKALKYTIDYCIETWPGAPLRPAEEQEFLWMMRDNLNKCVMEHTFHHLEVDKDK